jgi:alpha-mannosidase
MKPTESFLSVSPSNVIVTSVKLAEDSDAWVIQCYESSGRNSVATLEFPRKPKKVLRSNFVEEDVEEMICKGRSVDVPMSKNSIRTIKVLF